MTGEMLTVEGSWNRQSGAMTTLKSIIGDDDFETVDEVLSAIQAAGYQVDEAQSVGDVAQTWTIRASLPHRGARWWARRLELDWEAEFARLRDDPDGPRGRQLAAMVRDAGGLDAAVAAVIEIAPELGFEPHDSPQLRVNIEALAACPRCGSWCAVCLNCS